VLRVRDGTGGLQVLMTCRLAHARFAPGAYVFPGGIVEPQDRTDARAGCLNASDADETTRAARLAALRETFEEVGVLLARDANGRWADEARLAPLQCHTPLLPQCAAQDELHGPARWITDRDLPRRFDVAFFVAVMPPHQTPRSDDREQFELVWISPADALQRHARGELPMVFPTVRTLQRLSAY